MKKIIYVLIILLYFLLGDTYLTGQSFNESYNIDLADPYTNLNRLTGLQLYDCINQFNTKQNAISLRSDYKIKLDSVFYWNLTQSSLELNAKHEYVFDEEQLKEVIFYFDRENDNEWIAEAYAILHFNKKNLLTKQSYNIWNGDYDSIDETTSTVRREISYNDKNLIILYEDQNIGAIQENRILNRFVYSYDSLDNLSQIDKSRWNTNLAKIAETGKTLYRYNLDNQLSEVVEWEYKTNDGWQQKDSTILHYDEIGNIASDMRYVILFEDSLDIYSQKKYIYDSNDRLESRIDYLYYNKDKNDWWNKGVTKFTYDIENNLVNMSSYDSIIGSSNIELALENQYSHLEGYYKSEVQLPRETVLNFNSEILDNSGINPITEISEIIIGSGYNTIPVERKRTRLFYSDIPTSTTQIDNSISYSVSPNPATNAFKFEISDNLQNLDVMIYDAQGRLVKQKEFAGINVLDVFDLESGVYFYIVRSKTNDALMSGNGRFVKL